MVIIQLENCINLPLNNLHSNLGLIFEYLLLFEFNNKNLIINLELISILQFLLYNQLLEKKKILINLWAMN